MFAVVLRRLAVFSLIPLKLLSERNLLDGQTYSNREATLGTTEATANVFHSLSLSILLENTSVMTTHILPAFQQQKRWLIPWACIISGILLKQDDGVAAPPRLGQAIIKGVLSSGPGRRVESFLCRRQLFSGSPAVTGFGFECSQDIASNTRYVGLQLNRKILWCPMASSVFHIVQPLEGK